MSVVMYVAGINLQMLQQTAEPLVTLREVGGNRGLNIRVGFCEGRAIALELEHPQERPGGRPGTHDLLHDLLLGLEVQLRWAYITEFRDNTFYAVLELSARNQILRIDARPSDAIALAMRSKALILVEECVLEAQGYRTDSKTDPQALRQYLETMDPLKFGNTE